MSEKIRIPNSIVVLGPTASGKTKLAALLAYKLQSEVISADSRQVYRDMNIGSGKDYDDYVVEGKKVPHRLIDMVDPGYKYNVYEYQRDFFKIFKKLQESCKTPVICGGTGLYLEAVIKGYKLIRVPKNDELRSKLELHSDNELIKILMSFKKLHNTTDIKQRKRLIRAIEIESYYSAHPEVKVREVSVIPLVTGIQISREVRRERISLRLRDRLSKGMVEEVQTLLDKGISPDSLIYYGLEYKYITLYLTGKLSYKEMVQKLETSIHRFAKRQMTWFRGMEKWGTQIHWIDGQIPDAEKANLIFKWFKKA